MSTTLTLAAEPIVWIGTIGAVFLLLVFTVAFVATRYKRCPSNRVLVVYGRVAGPKAARCFHGGGAFILPLIQDHEYLSLEPLVIDIPLEGAVYTNVPEKGSGRGQVRVVVEGRDRIYNAISDRQAIPTSSRVRVVRVNQDHTLTVTPV